MKTGTKRFLSILVVILMLFSVMPAVYAEDIDPAPETESETADRGAASSEGTYAGKVIILHTNDVHGAIDKYAYVAGLKQDFLDKGAEAVLLVDAGDFSQGTVYVSDNQGKNGVIMMNAVGYDIATLGNHEFDYGLAATQSNLDTADFTVVCCNLELEDGSPLTARTQKSVLMSAGGITIGFIGVATPETRTKANPAKIKGLVVDGEEAIISDISEQVVSLENSGADLIICVSHLGVNDSSAPYRSYDIYNQFADKFDFMIDGHSHTVMEEGEKLERIQSTGSSLTDIGVIIIDAATKKIDTNYLYVISDDSPKNDTVAALAKDLMSQIDASYSEVFASTEVFLDGTRGANRTGETGLADLVADAMLWSVVSQSELELPEENYVAVINGGGIRANLPSTSSADNIVADITKKDVNTVLPFGNTVTVTYITGEMLLEALEASTYCSPASIGGFPQVSGMKYVIDINEEYDANEKAYPGSTYYGPKSINRVTITEINGKAFDPDATYAVVTNDFCANGGDTYYAFTIASKQFDTGVPVDEVLISYIGTVLNGVIGEKYGSSEGRITYTEPAPPAPVYEFTEGQGQTVDRSETGEVSFRINGPLESFEKLFIDGEETDPALYSAYEGSTVVVLSKQLVDSLSTGKHTIQAVFRDGTAEAPFYVADTSSSESPYTGLYTHRAEWILCLALASAMALVIAMRRRQMN